MKISELELEESHINFVCDSSILLYLGIEFQEKSIKIFSLVSFAKYDFLSKMNWDFNFIINAHSWNLINK